ncbi:NADPH-dependent oxidoreductase [Cytophagaceae bacterium 50C-KIRBA]|uniref:NADPH-dependent oxidoreductase n=1 Tax=Aquirufa beregesia TaxID=2516556 RepID=A0ABX0EU81_9BACT|nr:NAD(P)H-dependent oxidoreductase [Aquirufa beregesia]NGZ44094.1 NADPH-dependent oxidoreductase [Aquirufa beregesia]
MKKKIFAIVGSASSNSSNLKLLQYVKTQFSSDFEVEIFDQLAQIPHFNPEQSQVDPPISVIEIRNRILIADGIMICSPEYIFSIPSVLKNVLEWCVATTVFSEKPTCLITASADGKMGDEELRLIMKTLNANFTVETSLLISGIRGKLDEEGNPLDSDLRANLKSLIHKFETLLTESMN